MTTTFNRRDFFMAIAATVASAPLRPSPMITAMLDESRVPTAERIAKVEALREYQFYVTSWQYNYDLHPVEKRVEGKPQRMKLDLALTNGDFTVYTESLHEEPSPKSWGAIHDAFRSTRPVTLRWDSADHFSVQGADVNIKHFMVCRSQIDVTSLGDEARRYVYGLRVP